MQNIIFTLMHTVYYRVLRTFQQTDSWRFYISKCIHVKRLFLSTCKISFLHLCILCTTVMILSFRTDMPGQTVQTQIRLRSSLIRVYTVFHSICIVWTHYSMVDPHSSNFRVITTNCLGVRIFRKFTVIHRFDDCYG